MDEMAVHRKSHADEMSALKKQLAQDMARMKSQHESEMNSQRSTFETKISELEISLRDCQKTIVKLESEVLERDAIIAEKHDVEKQRDSWRAHHDSMQEAKREL